MHSCSFVSFVPIKRYTSAVFFSSFRSNLLVFPVILFRIIFLFVCWSQSLVLASLMMRKDRKMRLMLLLLFFSFHYFIGLYVFAEMMPILQR
jgi:uncharacterized SAM-binding protein YcdF (DUF218 family)